MLVCHHDLERHANSLGFYLQGQGHSVGSNPLQIKCWTFCKQTWYSGASSHSIQNVVTILDCCAHGQGHSEGSNPQGIFVLTISFEPQPFVMKLMACQCITMTQCRATNLGSGLQGAGWNPRKITSISPEVLNLLQAHGVVVHHHKLECLWSL